jgi:flotillin
MPNIPTAAVIVLILVGVLVILPAIVASFLRNVEAGTIRMVSWMGGGTVIYRGPGKSKEVPLFTTGTTLSSKAINVDLDITDQTADLDEQGTPRPIKVRVLASAIVSVGDSDTLIKTAANRFFSKPEAEQVNILIDLLSSSGRRAINLLTHDQLFSAKTAPVRALPNAVGAYSTAVTTLPNEGRALTVVPSANAAVDAAEDDDDPLAVIIRKACSRELTDLGLIFNSLNIKVVQSEVAEARRRQSAAEAQANAEIVAANQTRRAKEAQLEAERAISDKQRELEQTRAANAALIAQAEAKKQDALAIQRTSELEATQIAQARADAERVRIGAQASAQAEAIRITTVAEATSESIRKVNAAIQAGGESYFRYRQIEMLPQIAPAIAEALSQAKLITISGNGEAGGAAGSATSNIAQVIQTVLAAQLVTRGGMLDGGGSSSSNGGSDATSGASSEAGGNGSTPTLSNRTVR